jgi:NHL repeat-containing protein
VGTFRLRAGAGAAGLLLLALAWGCGSKFVLPSQDTGGLVPAKDEYIYTGELSGVAGKLTDVLITRSSGTQLLVAYGAEPDTYSSCTAPGRNLPGGTLALYPIFPSPGQPPLSITFGGLWRPQHMAEGGGRLFVFDAGDTCLRRTQPAQAPKILVYQIGTSAPLTTFADTNWAEVRGIAASDDRTVYVSGTFKIAEPDEFGRTTLHFRDGVWRYKESNGYGRDGNWSVLEGSGTGFVSHNKGIAWGPRSNPYLWVTDGEKQAVQKLLIEADSLSHGIYQFDGTQSGERFQDPVDVTVDDDGNIFVVDRTTARVLRYADLGGSADFTQVVNTGKPVGSPNLHLPVAVAVLDTMVYAGDPPSSAALRFERRH